MNEANFRDLLKRYLEGRCDASESAIVEEWLLNFYRDSPVRSDNIDYDTVGDRIWSRITEQHRYDERRKARVKKFRITITSAAAIAIMVGGWFYNSATKNENTSFLNVSYTLPSNDIPPGNNIATLTIGNREIVDLHSEDQGVNIADSLSKQLFSSSWNDKEPIPLVLKTPRGGTCKFTLPDGSVVWLNADSKIDFSSNLATAQQRIVHLSGEAYFEVAKRHHRPFVVKSNGQTVQVLGTKFNVKVYSDESFSKTTLLEGSVKVNEAKLEPGEQAIIGKNSNIHIKKVNAEDIVAWKDGIFIFDATPLEQVMSQISRWYDVEVVYSDPSLKSELIGGAVSRYNNVSHILETLQHTGVVKFQLNGHKIIVNK